jgi:hypothetical protein
VESLKEALSPPLSKPVEQIDKVSLVQNWRQDQEDTTYDAVDFSIQSLGDGGMHETQSFKDPGYETVDVEDSNRLSRYGKLVFEAPAYQWLLASLKREYQLMPAESNIMEAIKQEIIRYLPPSREISRSRSAEAYRITYQLHWDSIAFIQEQGYVVVK